MHNFFRNFDVPIGVLLLTLPSGCSVDKESSKERNGTKTSFFQACDFASTQIEKILYLKISVPQKAFKRFQLRVTTPNNIKEDAKVESVGNTEKPNPLVDKRGKSQI